MNKKTINLRILRFLFALLFLFSISSCTKKPHPSIEGLENKVTEEINILSYFKNGHDQSKFQIAFWSNGYPFNCRWSKESIKFTDEGMNMSIFEKDGTYYGGEYRTHERFSYGYFSVRMQPIKCDGVITSFFTYTHNPWDEIDIEFLGNDTTKVQFNYYTKGKGGHEYHYDLGFDASIEMHEYGFEWLPDSITWYVDSIPVYRATKDIPTTSAQLLANVWNVHPDVKNWAGLFKGETLPVTAKYEWFAYTPYQPN